MGRYKQLSIEHNERTGDEKMQFCTTVSSWVTQYITSPVNTWVNQMQQQCQQLPWWNPLGWLCWFVTISVQVTVWVTTNIVVQTLTITCIFVSTLIGLFLWPFGAAINAVCQSCNASQWVVNVFFYARITLTNKVASSTNPGYFDYTFTCNCNPFKRPTITIQAMNDNEAAELAKLECAKVC